MKFLILSEWKFMDQIACWQCISLILDSGECFVGDLEPIEYLAAYDQNDMLKYDWELVMHFAPKKIYYAHANEKYCG